MRCLPVVVAALFALPGCIDPSLGTATSASTDPPVITLLHVNDTHSHLASWGPKDWRLDGTLVIVNGHDHVALAEPESVGSTLIVSAGEYYRWVGRLRIAVESDHVELVDYALLDVDRRVPPLPAIHQTVAGLEAGITSRYGDVYHRVIGWAIEPLLDEPAAHRHQDKRDTAIGDLFTDGYRAATHTDVAIEANGFLDTGLPAGPLVPVDVYRSMSYGLPTATSDGFIVRPFRLATFEMTGLQLLTALEVALAGPPDIFPQVSGMRFDYDSSKPPGQRVLVDSVHVAGRRIALDASYTLTANEGLLMFLPGLGITFENPRILDESASHAVQTLISRRLVIDAATSGRIRDRARMPGHP